jgi:hypothetical protein
MLGLTKQRRKGWGGGGGRSPKKGKIIGKQELQDNRKMRREEKRGKYKQTERGGRFRKRNWGGES